jgi:hypothetical protein
MSAFDPKAWTARFEGVGGIVGFSTDKAGSHLWTGVIVRRPDRGAEARKILAELSAHPEWHGALEGYAKDRLRGGGSSRRPQPGSASGVSDLR